MIMGSAPSRCSKCINLTNYYEDLQYNDWSLVINYDTEWQH
jgi:hypothetical protein